VEGQLVPTLAQIERFCVDNLRVRGGGRFSLQGREWVREHVWLPLIGFKWWRLDEDGGTPLCAGCRKRANTLTEWTWDNPSAVGRVDDLGEVEWITKPEHEAEAGCLGLQLVPTVYTWLRLRRRAGKTVNVGALFHALGFLSSGHDMVYLANAEDQAQRLFQKHFTAALGSDEDEEGSLLDEVKIKRTTIIYEDTESKFQFINSSASAGTGEDLTALAFDECRDMEFDTFTAVLPAVWNNRGWECPSGCIHFQWQAGLHVPSDCNVCSCRLQPWYGRVCAMSSAGELKGGDHDWHDKTVKKLAANPDKNAHVFDADVKNPAVSDHATGPFERMFSDDPDLAHAVDIEAHNESRVRGEDFVGQSTVKACLSRIRANAGGSVRPCVAFLDCSRTGELTSFAILEDVGVEAGEEPWLHLEQVRLDIWAPDPGRLTRAALDAPYLHDVPRGIVDDALVLTVLDELVPRFPGLRWFGVDTRGLAWAAALAREAGRRSWGRGVVEGLQRRADERQSAFSALQVRLLNRASGRGRHPQGMQSIELLPCEQTLYEFGKARRRVDARGAVQVTERQRRVGHLDVIDTLAMGCFGAHRLVLRGEHTDMRTANLGGKKKARGFGYSRRAIRPVTSGQTEDSML